MTTTERFAHLREAMERRSLDLAVVGPGANLRYLLDFRAMAVDRITVLLLTSDSAVMLLPDFDVDEFAHATGFEPIVGWNDKRGPRPAVDEAFGRLGPLPSDPTVAIDDELPFAFLAELREALGRGTQVRLSEILGPLRAVKSADEQRRIARAGELISAGIDFACQRARPGVTERSLAAEIETMLREDGADSVDFVLVAAGEGSAAPHHQAGDRSLVSGEPVLFDIAVPLDGYFADITQQVFLGDPPAEYRRAYETVLAAQEAGVAAAVSGATTHAVDRAATEVIVEAGLGEWSGPRTGHGLGLDVHEPPSVVEGGEVVLEPGFVITVEPGVYIPGKYGIRIEDTVLVTADGPVRLTRGTRPLLSR